MNKTFRAILILLSLSLVIVPVSYAAYLYSTTKGAIDLSFSKNSDKSNLREKAVDPSMDHISILFLGIDDSISRRENGQKVSEARTDAMILATFDRSNKQIRLVSIPRDTLAYIPSVKQYDKITHAHAEGGPESSMHAVENIFNVPVDYYARINMQAFVDIVDELGGIEFDVPFDINEPTKLDKGRIKVKKGKQLINGDEALALVRSRHVDTDLGRGKRQMQMIEAIVKKAKDTNSISKLDELVEIVGNNAKHNLTFENITSLASYYTSNDVAFKQMQLKGTDYMYNGVYYYNPVFEHIYKISKLLRKDLQLPEEKKSSLLDYKVIALKGDLIPLEKIDLEQIEKDFKQLMKDKKKKNKKNKKNNTKENKTNESNNGSSSKPIATEAPKTVESAPVTEQAPPVIEEPAPVPVITEAPVIPQQNNNQIINQAPATSEVNPNNSNNNSVTNTNIIRSDINANSNNQSGQAPQNVVRQPVNQNNTVPLNQQ
ncbi:LytR family transcriptional regulator [Macrococcoides goetzii]|uniref:LytR family transcriptional regulator n=1 Tax=Macrococcoides goetzii TaxID=1891097 RepID=A0A2G5NME8_9STAP|nr:LCP family protein [Macrococcus goetzii]RAI83081.1 LytR family transcriptional regulator [Macrococcus goetzii]